jgi:hypothetical protein
MVIIFKVATEFCLNVEALLGLGFPRSIAFRMVLWLSGRKNHRVFVKRKRGLDWLRER